MEDYLELKEIITDKTNNNRFLYNFMIHNPNYDYKVIVELAILYRELDLVKMTLDYHGQNTVKFWNDLLFTSTVTGERNFAKYCIDQGANNLGECFYRAIKYGNPDLADYFIEIKLDKNKKNKYTKENINTFFNNKQYDLIYEFFTNKQIIKTLL